MNLHLQDKIILISGGAKGIGGAITRGLIEEGAIPVIIDPSEKEGNELIALAKGKALHLPWRLFSAADCQKVIEETIQVFGRIDGVVNNAGANDGVGLENGSPEAFANSIANNLHHYFSLVHFALPELKKKQRFDSQYLLQNCRHRTRRDLRLCGSQRRSTRPHP